MLVWAKECLGSFLLLCPPPAGIMPVILLDSYQCHMMGSVIHAIQELGIEVIHIPGGCTGLLQPLDVGLNKPFKVRVRASWDKWMMAMIDNHAVIESPTRDDIASWATSAHWDMDDKPMMKKVWKKTGYSWFVEDEPTAEAEPVVAEGGVTFLDKEEAAIDQHDDCDDMEDKLEYMMENEGMTVDIRAMMEEMERLGVLMDN